MSLSLLQRAYLKITSVSDQGLAAFASHVPDCKYLALSSSYGLIASTQLCCHSAKAAINNTKQTDWMGAYQTL